LIEAIRIAMQICTTPRLHLIEIDRNERSFPNQPE
jgi:hypothetical protein